MRVALLAIVVVVGTDELMRLQPQLDAKLQSQLMQLFPQATFFARKSGDPPHYKVYVGDNGPSGMLAGFAFWTTELEPLERGYDGPIKMLVGMDLKGILTGVVVVEHHEPYGSFSIEPPRFAAQFRGKNIRDPFKVGGDVYAVSRASITITSAARAVKNSARRVARQLLPPPAF
jgi:NosR/NirI family transcriptional regulator, nitrous oxide reductase regulator